jgi:patatin-like phospholipase/acyl hydrolase
MVAHGIIALEEKLGMQGRPLIEHPHLRVMAGTSTGALITGAIAAGMTGAEILQLYIDLGKVIFSKSETLRPFGKQTPLLSAIRPPVKLVQAVKQIPVLGELFMYSLLPARYDWGPFTQAFSQVMATQHKKGLLPSPNPTIKELGDWLRSKPNQATLIITTVEVMNRRTHFIKTTSTEQFPEMQVIDALRASSCIPTMWYPVISAAMGETYGGQPRSLIDGGVGNFGNPALVAAWELCNPRNKNLDKAQDAERQHDPQTVTIYSFGTGFVSEWAYWRKFGSPQGWWALNWAGRSLDLFVDSTVREQSRDIVEQYRGIDLRRFQIALDAPIAGDNFSLIPTVLQEKGKILAERVRLNQHARKGPQFDPEGIWH